MGAERSKRRQVQVFMESEKDELQLVHDAQFDADRPEIFPNRVLADGELTRNLPAIPTLQDVINNGLFPVRQGANKLGRALRAGIPNFRRLGHALSRLPNLAIRDIASILFPDSQLEPPVG